MDEAIFRCPKCSYDLWGSVESRCPECGTAFQVAEIGATLFNGAKRIGTGALIGRLSLLPLGCSLFYFYAPLDMLGFIGWILRELFVMTCICWNTISLASRIDARRYGGWVVVVPLFLIIQAAVFGVLGFALMALAISGMPF